MANDKLTYRVVEGLPSKALLDEILEVYKAIFEDYKLDFFKSRISEKEDLIITLSFYKESLGHFLPKHI